MKVRSAEIKDGEKILSIYTPYVLNTAITFEYTPPTISEMERRIEERRGRYPFRDQRQCRPECGCQEAAERF